MPSAFGVRKLARDEKGFYEAMGPLFGSREVAKEVGINMYDDADKTWFVCFSGPVVIGCASVRGRIVSDCYVVPASRGAGVFGAILDSLLSSTAGTLRANCTSASLRSFKARGFKPVRSTINFTYVELDRA